MSWWPWLLVALLVFSGVLVTVATVGAQLREWLPLFHPSRRAVLERTGESLRGLLWLAAGCAMTATGLAAVLLIRWLAVS